MIMVLGYYGYDNLGDEAILATLCHDLEELGITRENILVPSGNPRKTKEDHRVNAINRLNVQKIWQALGQVECLIVGGGSLLQDITSKRSIPYYLSIVELAFLKKMPVFMYAQGVGPLDTALYRKWVKRTYTLSTAYTVRDEQSAKLLEKLGVPSDHGSVTADPIFQNPARNFTGTGNRLLLNLRPYDLWLEQEELWTYLIQNWFSQGFRVEFIPLGPGDQGLGLSLQEKVPKLEIHPTLDLASLETVYLDADFCVSMRLHGIIFAALNGVLPLGLNYDPKVQAISEQLQIPFYNLAQINELEWSLNELSSERKKHEERCAHALKDLEERAQGNVLKLAQVVGRCSK